MVQQNQRIASTNFSKTIYQRIKIFQRSSIPWNGSQPQQLVKGISFNYFKTIKRALTWNTRCFHRAKITLFWLEKLSCCIFGIIYYNLVGSPKNGFCKRIRKFISRDNCFSITYKFDWRPYILPNPWFYLSKIAFHFDKSTSVDYSKE